MTTEYSPKEIVFFDIDGTLTKGNVQFAFLRFLRKKHIVSTAQYVWVAIQYALFLIGFSSLLHYAFDQALCGLKGKTQEQLQNIIRDFLRSEMPTPYQEAMSIINEHKKAGRSVVLLTTVVEPLSHAIAEKIGVDDAIGTCLELRNKIYTGHIAGNIMYGQEKVIASYKYLQTNGVNWSYAWAYADSTSDVPLLKKVAHAFAINPSQKMQSHIQHTSCTTLLFT